MFCVVTVALSATSTFTRRSAFFHKTQPPMNSHTHLRYTVGRLAVLPSRVRSQVLSPTPLLRSSARRTRLRTQHQEEQVSVPHTIPLRRYRTTLFSGEVDDPRIGRLASPLLEQKREARVIVAWGFHSQRESSTSHSPHRSKGKPCCKTLIQAEIEQGPNEFKGKTARQRRNSN